MAKTIDGWVVALSVVAEGITNIPLRFLPARVAKPEMPRAIGVGAWAVLAIALLLEIPIDDVRSTIATERMAPRHLTKVQQADIAETMSAWARLPGDKGLAQGVVILSGIFEEQRALKKQIEEALGPGGAGWRLKAGSYGRLDGGNQAVGIRVLTFSSARPNEVAHALADALSRAGLYVQPLPEFAGTTECTVDLDACSTITVEVQEKP